MMGLLAGCQRADPAAVRVIGIDARAQQPSSVAAREVVQPLAATQISVGLAHACACMRDGSAWCWGENDKGQLGDGTTRSSAGMVRVKGIGEASEVVAGFYASCALVRDGSVWCWGGNPHGELGDGTTAEHPVPVRVARVEQAKDVALGTNFGCALIADGTVRCWGSPRYAKVHAAEPVPGLDHVVRIASSLDHACALRDDGTLWCWGSNMAGQLGYGGIEVRRSCSIGPLEEWVTPSGADDPKPVPNLGDVIQVALGASRTCALRRGGGIWCSTDPRDSGHHSPQVELPGARQLAVFWPWQKGVVCAVIESGELRCAGINDRGQLGAETLDGPFDFVVRTAKVSDVAEVRMGRNSSCARTNAGEVWCWPIDDAPTFAQKVMPARVQRVHAAGP
jgi:alpha-tubulin suppressor-like RCC1 family protein